MRRELQESPLKVADGYVFQFAEDDQRTILGALPGMKENNLILFWRQLDNTTVPVDHVQLKAYYDEMFLLYSKRGILVDTTYMELKQKNTIYQYELVQWKKQIAADWWE